MRSCLLLCGIGVLVTCLAGCGPAPADRDLEPSSRKVSTAKLKRLEVSDAQLQKMSPTELSQLAWKVTPKDVHLREKLDSTLRGLVRKAKLSKDAEPYWLAAYDFSIALGRCRPHSIENIERLCANSDPDLKLYGSWSLTEYADIFRNYDVERVLQIAARLKRSSDRQTRLNGEWVLRVLEVVNRPTG